MNEARQKQLFAAVRRETPPEPPSNFPALVVAAIARDTRQAARPSLLDLVGGLFPRVATAALAVIALCVAADWFFNFAADGGLNEQIAQVTDQWLFASQ
jgi:hypothetical protein